MLSVVSEAIRNCTKCTLCKSRTNPVTSDGNEKATIMFIGEAPGHNEDLEGKPFVGTAGELLNEILKKAGISRSDIFVTNILKCRPPNNRQPLPNEIEACSQHLLAQISVIKPKIIVTLGLVSSRFIFGLSSMEITKMSDVHGVGFAMTNTIGEFYVFPTFHPASALRQKQYKEMLEEDMKKLKTTTELLALSEKK